MIKLLGEAQKLDERSLHERQVLDELNKDEKKKNLDSTEKMTAADATN